MPAHVWTLSWFDPAKENLVGNKDFPLLSDHEAAEILAVSVDDALSGEFAIDEMRADRFRSSTGYIMQLSLFDYFLGATTSSQFPLP